MVDARTQEILEERARALARPTVAQVAPSRQGLDLLVCAVGNERCALETARILHVGRSPRLTTIAAVAAPFVALANHAGEIIPVVDLGAVLGMPTTRTRNTMLVIGERAPELGLLVDEALEAIAIDRTSLSPAAILPEALATIVVGVSPDGVSVIDVAALLASPRLFLRRL